MEPQKTINSKTDFEEKTNKEAKNDGGITILDLKIYYRPIVIKTI